MKGWEQTNRLVLKRLLHEYTLVFCLPAARPTSPQEAQEAQEVGLLASSILC